MYEKNTDGKYEPFLSATFNKTNKSFSCHKRHSGNVDESPTENTVNVDELQYDGRHHQSEAANTMIQQLGGSASQKAASQKKAAEDARKELTGG